MTRAAVAFTALHDGFLFASCGGVGECTAYVCLATGAIHWHSEFGDNEEPLPEDIEDGEKYIALPHKNELDLGKPLVLDFARERMPDAEDEIRDMFAHRGAYARFKDFLDRRGMLAQWYGYETRAEEQALRQWCADNGIEVDG